MTGTKGTREITNSENTIDSREIVERIEYLESLELDESDEDEIDESNKEELRLLKALAEECEGYGDWIQGIALIREDFFEEYAREFAEDIGAISDDVSWPCNCIDWERAARELKIDYTEVDFDGVSYLFR